MVQKTINDYYEQLYKEFPNIPKSDIKILGLGEAEDLGLLKLGRGNIISKEFCIFI